jgi:GT2 family glycosyltransferase
MSDRAKGAATAAVITVNYHSTALIRRLEAVVDGDPGLKLYVADNSGEFAPSRPETAVIKPGANIGFGRACNLAARAASEDVLLFVNPDVETGRDALGALAAGGGPHTVWGPIIDDGHGWSSAVVARPGRLPPLARIGFPVERAGEHKSVYVSGACLCIRRELFLRLGGFREDIFLYAEDLDLCHRAAELGASIVTLEHVTVRHVSGRSSSRLWPKALRLTRSIRGHYTFLSGHFPRGIALITAVYLASGRQVR